jgi:ATP-binding cassette subfamily C exporter for protease/lipase
MMTKPSNSELMDAVVALRPFFLKAWWMTLFASLLLLTPSIYMLEVYDRVVNSRNSVTLAMLTILVLMLFGVMEVLDWARGEVMREAGAALDQKMGPRLFRAMFAASLKRTPGGTLQTMHDLRTLRDFLQSPVIAALMELPVAMLFLVLVFAIHPLLGWFAMVGAFVQAALAWFNERTTQPLMLKANRAAMTSQQQVEAMLRNAQVVQAMGLQQNMYRRWDTIQQEFIGDQAAASARAGTVQASTKFWQNVVSSGLLGIACWLLLNRQLNGGGSMMIVASILGGRVLAPLVQGVSQWKSVVQFVDAWRRCNQLLQTIPIPPIPMPLPRPKGLLQVEGLVASAPGGNAPILKGLSFSLKPGEVLAVVGPSAAGKTTLARMLTGLWSASSGKVRLDGVDVQGWDKAELGPNVGYLPQGVELVDGTLAENIARFAPADRSAVEAAARAVGLHEWAMQLPNGYDSPVGRDGSKLSGGMRQRVGLARALFGQPVFVVLDEPNSSLDEAGDAALVAAIAQLKALGTTFVVMTHRSGVLAVTDKILVLRDGQSQGFGPRDEVLAALRQAAAPQPAEPVAVH